MRYLIMFLMSLPLFANGVEINPDFLNDLNLIAPCHDIMIQHGNTAEGIQLFSKCMDSLRQSGLLKVIKNEEIKKSDSPVNQMAAALSDLRMHHFVAPEKQIAAIALKSDPNTYAFKLSKEFKLSPKRAEALALSMRQIAELNPPEPPRVQTAALIEPKAAN